MGASDKAAAQAFHGLGLCRLSDGRASGLRRPSRLRAPPQRERRKERYGDLRRHGHGAAQREVCAVDCTCGRLSKLSAGLGKLFATSETRISLTFQMRDVSCTPVKPVLNRK